jgi:hypothetical protein
MAEKRVNPFEFVQGGLINDVDVEVIEAAFVRWDYGEYGADDSKFIGNGKGPEITAFTMAFELASGDKARQFWSVGGEDDFMPSKDGSYLLAAGDRSTLNQGSNYFLLTASVENCLGEKPPQEVADDVSLFKGLKGHVLRVPQPKREGLKNVRKREDGEEREKTVLTFNDIKTTPWDKGSKKRGSRKTSPKEEPEEKESKSSKASSNGDSDDVAGTLVKKALMAAGGELSLEELGYEVYKLAPKDKAERKAITDLVNDPKWVAKIDDVSVDGDKVTLE